MVYRIIVSVFLSLGISGLEAHGTWSKLIGFSDQLPQKHRSDKPEREAKDSEREEKREPLPIYFEPARAVLYVGKGVVQFIKVNAVPLTLSGLVAWWAYYCSINAAPLAYSAGPPLVLCRSKYDEYLAGLGLIRCRR